MTLEEIYKRRNTIKDLYNQVHTWLTTTFPRITRILESHIYEYKNLNLNFFVLAHRNQLIIGVPAAKRFLTLDLKSDCWRHAAEFFIRLYGHESNNINIVIAEMSLGTPAIELIPGVSFTYNDPGELVGNGGQ